VDRRVDPHRHFVGVLTSDPLIHIEEIAVALADHMRAQALDRVGEVEVHAAPARPDAAALVADRLGGA
jgi:hypothetical protein